MISIIAPFAFYALAFVLVGAALGVVLTRNPVHSVLALVLCFFGGAGIFLLLGAEFLAFVLVIVYAGAIAVLFLFVVMMLDLHRQKRAALSWRKKGVGLAVGVALAAHLTMVAATWRVAGKAASAGVSLMTIVSGTGDNTHALGRALYTAYALPFQTAGLALLTAMVGAVALAQYGHSRARAQDARRQKKVLPERVVTLVEVEPRKGAL